jgi:hypothetical protein
VPKKTIPFFKFKRGLRDTSLKFALFGFGVDYSHDDSIFIDFELPQGALEIISSVGRNGIK